MKFLIHYTVVAAVGLMIANGCKSDTAREAATQQALQPAAETTEKPLPNQKPAMSSETVGTFNLAFSSQTAAKGNEACVAVSARNFERIVSMQYSIKWDKSVLKFKEVKGFGLPGLNAANFGTHLIEKEGILTHSWFDPNVQGISKPDGFSLYQLCFEAVGAPGSKSAIQFVNAPVIFEISNADSQFLELQGTQGTIEVK